MIWIWGPQARGVIEEVDGDRIETEFLVVQGFLPLFPIKSYLRFRDQSRIALPSLHLKSVCLGYARTYLPIVAFGLSILELLQVSPDHPNGAIWITGVTIIVLGLVALAGLMRMGGVSGVETRRRRACFAQIGAAVNLHVLQGATATLRPRLEIELKARLAKVVGVSYRAELDPFSIAEKLDDTDIDILRLLLILAPLWDRDAEGEVLWQRLTKLPDALLFAPKTAFVVPEQEPDANVSNTAVPAAPRGPVPLLAREPGSPISLGVEVEFGHYPTAFPPKCASCLGPSETGAAVRKHFGPFTKKANTFAPYCLACSNHDYRERNRQSVGHVFRVVGLASLGGLLAIPLSIPTGLLVVTPLFLLAWFGSLWIAPPRRTSGPATTTMGAFATLWRPTKKSTFFCTNREWAAEFAAANGGTVREGKLLSAGYGNIALVAAAGLLTFGTWMYRLASPEVYIDVQNQEPMVVWLDGEIVATLAPNDGPLPRMIRIPRGRHQLGIGTPDSKVPSSMTDIVVQFNGKHLYDPLRQHCYYLEQEFYEASNPPPANVFPVEVTSFYVFAQIDNWFADNPRSIEVKRTDRKMLVAIKRAPMCESETLRGCSPEIRSKAWACVDPHQTAEVVEACVGEAIRPCVQK